MKKKLMTLTVLLMTAALTACVSDDSTTGDLTSLSLIKVDSTSISSTYHINKNETLTIEPHFSQTNAAKPVSYTWEINQEVYSTEPVFKYRGDRLGSYNCRLILANDDGRTFFHFTLNVNSPYEEGLTVLSHDADGHSRLSFMLTPTDGSKPQFYDEDCFAVNNPDMAMVSNAVDMTQSSGTLIIACQGQLSSDGLRQAGNSDDQATIYYLNDKTFVIENMLSAPEYPDFVPTRMHIPSVGLSGASYPILTRCGKVFEFSSTEGALSEARLLQGIFAPSSMIEDPGAGRYYNIVFWDTEVGDLCHLYNGYGPYFCSKTYNCTRDKCSGSNNYFLNRSFVQVVPIDRTDAQKTTSTARMLVITRNSFMYQKTIMSPSFWEYNYDTAETVLVDNGGTQTAGFGESNFTETTPCIANMTFYSLLYGVGNQVFKWNFTSSQDLTNAQVLQTVGSSEAIITDFAQSADHRRTYVAFYEPGQTGLNGSVWVIDTDKGDILQKYDNISYQPVKLLYKMK